MKKLIFIFLALLSFSSYGQATFDEGVQIAGGQPTVTTTPFITSTASDGLQTKILGQNVPVPQVPLNYTPAITTIGGHLAGIDIAIGTVTDALNTLNIGLVYKKTIAQIRALSGTLPTNYFYTTDTNKEGNWYYDSTDVVSADNTGTVLVTADGKRIKRIFYDSANIQWFGAVGDGTTDNTTFIQSAIATGKKIFIPEGTFITSNITLLTNSSISGLGEKSILKFKTGSTGYMLNGDLVGGINLDKVALYGADDIEYQTVASIGTRSGIYLNTNLPKSKITNCKIYGFNAIGAGYNGTVTSKDNKSLDINNCNFLSNYCAISTAPSGVNHYTTVSGGAGGEYSNIIGSSFYLNRYAVVASAGNTNVTGNVISNNGYGIYMTSVSNVGHGNIVSNLINHSTVNSIEMADNIISHVISGNAIYSGNIVFTNCTGIIFSGNQISVSGITITGTGFHNFADNFYFLDPIFSGGLTNCIFSNNFSRTLNEFVNNDSFVGKITSGFIPRANSVGRFVNANIYDDGTNIGIGTTSPLIGKLTVATGTALTTSISSQGSGTFSMSNNGSGATIPVLSSKSDTSVGMYLIGATADTHAGSTDFQINVRKTDNSDFTTLTNSAFKFSRFNTTLVDILRNGNTTFAGNLSAPLFTGTATLTGTPTAPTPTAGDNDTSIATTAFVTTADNLKANIASPTFTTGITTPAVNVSGQTASTIAIFDASKNIVSASTGTYPSLTELSYIKGVTSSIQTQINAVSRPYKSYCIKLTQTGTSAPTVTYTLENTVGTITWTRNSTGTYYATSSSLFVGPSKCSVSAFFGSFQASGEKILGYNADANTCVISTTASNGTVTDGLLSNAFIEIRVYN